MFVKLRTFMRREDPTWRQSRYVFTMDNDGTAGPIATVDEHRCPAGHVLQWGCPYTTWYCNRWRQCRTVGDARDLMRWSCEKCGYDLCKRCLGAPVKEVQMPPLTKRTLPHLTIPEIMQPDATQVTLCAPEMPSPTRSSLTAWSNVGRPPRRRQKSFMNTVPLEVPYRPMRCRRKSTFTAIRKSLACNYPEVPNLSEQKLYYDPAVNKVLQSQTSMRKSLASSEREDFEMIEEEFLSQGTLLRCQCVIAGIWWERASCVCFSVVGHRVTSCAGGEHVLAIDSNLMIGLAMTPSQIRRYSETIIEWSSGEIWLREATLPSKVLEITTRDEEKENIAQKLAELCDIDDSSVVCVVPPKVSPYWASGPSIAGSERTPFNQGLWATRRQHTSFTSVAAAAALCQRLMKAYANLPGMLLEAILDVLSIPPTSSPHRVLFDMTEQFWFHYNHIYPELKNHERNPRQGRMLSLFVTSVCSFNGADIDSLVGYTQQDPNALSVERNTNVLLSITNVAENFDSDSTMLHPLLRIMVQYSCLTDTNNRILYRCGGMQKASCMNRFLSLQAGDTLHWVGPTLATQSEEYADGLKTAGEVCVMWRIVDVPEVCHVGRCRTPSEDKMVLIPPLTLFEVVSCPQEVNRMHVITIRFVKNFLKSFKRQFIADASTSELRLRELFVGLQQPHTTLHCFILSRTEEQKLQPACLYFRTAAVAKEVLSCRECPYKGHRQKVVRNLAKWIANILGGEPRTATEKNMLLGLLEVYGRVTQDTVNHPAASDAALEHFKKALQHAELAVVTAEAAFLFIKTHPLEAAAQPMGDAHWTDSMATVRKGLLVASMPAAMQVKLYKLQAGLVRHCLERVLFLLEQGNVLLEEGVLMVVKFIAQLGGSRIRVPCEHTTQAEHEINWAAVYEPRTQIPLKEPGIALLCVAAAVAAFRPPNIVACKATFAAACAAAVLSAVEQRPWQSHVALLLKLAVDLTFKGDKDQLLSVVTSFPELQHYGVMQQCWALLDMSSINKPHVAKRTHDATNALLADIGYTMQNRSTALHYSCRRGDVLLTSILLQHGNMDVEAVDALGGMALHAGLTSVECVGRETGEVVADERIVRSRVKEDMFSRKCGEELLKLLCTKRVVEQREGVWCETALHKACRGGMTNTAKILIEMKANVAVPDKHGTVPLHYAVAQSSFCLPQNIQTLRELAVPAAIVAFTPVMGTPLHAAVCAASVPAVTMLLSLSANPRYVSHLPTPHEMAKQVAKTDPGCLDAILAHLRR